MSRQQAGIFWRFFSYIGRSIVNFIKLIFKFLFSIMAIWIISFVIMNALMAPTPLPENAALVIAPRGNIVEQLTFKEPLLQLLDEDEAQEILLTDLIEAIDHAATDTRINSLVLYPEKMLGGSLNVLNTIGAALDRFKAANKKVVAVADNYSQNSYYLASHADTIYLNSFGSVEVLGISTVRPYFKEAMDKLKINLHVFKVGTYKDAVEPFTRTSMSAASRLHNSEWIAEIWQAYTHHVEIQRELPKGAVDDYIENIDNNLVSLNGDTAQLALTAKLVDKIVTRPERTQALINLAGSNNSGTFAQIDLQRYLKHLHSEKNNNAYLPTSNEATTQIGVIVANGEILDGKQPSGTIGGDSLAQLIRQTGENDNIKALVLRVNSPGGSAFASEIIRQELLQIQHKGIPVVVSMGAVAASGGYWIAADADQIWASPTTITGSIGVFGMLPTFEESFNSIGIHFDEISSTSLATARSAVLPMKAKTTKIIQASVDGIYQKFLNLVAQGRDSTPEAINDIAQGRVWTGRRAQELGLVDYLGDIEQAISSAAALAGVDQYEVQYLEKPLTFQEYLLRELANDGIKIANWLGITQLSSTSLLAMLDDTLTPLNVRLNALNDPQGLYLNCFNCSIND